MTVADRIRNKRCDLQLSQEELAKRANYSDKTRISKIENSGDDISMKQIKRIAEALGVTTAYLMGWETDVEIVDSEQKEKEYINRMRAYYEGYMNATPEVRSAIDLLLESSQRKK